MSQVAALLCECLEAIVHQLLFVRQLYSPELFERQRLYGVAVRKSRHPELNQYISEVVSSLQVRAVPRRGRLGAPIAGQRGLGRHGRAIGGAGQRAARP